MRKIVKGISAVLVLAIFVVGFSLPASAALIGGGEGFYYKLNTNKTASLEEYHGSGGDVVIPSSVMSYTVVTVAENTFSNNTSIKSATIPNTVKTIGAYSFYGCSALESVTISNSASAIKAATFYNCKSLKTAYIPSSVTSIARNAFIGCDELTIIGQKGSAAETYALEQGINFMDINDLPKPHTVTYMVDGEIYGEVETVNAGDKITPREEPSKDGYTFSGWSDIPAVMPDNDIVISGTFTVIPEKSYVKSASLVLDGTIGVKFTLELSDTILNDSGAYVVMTKNDDQKKILVSDSYQKNGNAYSFKYEVPSPEFRDQIVIKLYDGSGENVMLYGKSSGNPFPDGLSYSVERYINNLSASAPENLAALVSALKDYCTSTSLFFDYNSDDLTYPDSAKETIDLSLLDDFKAVSSSTTLPEGIKNRRISVLTESDNTLRLTFVLDSGYSADNFRFFIDGEEITEPVVSGSEVRLDVRNIAAKELGDSHEFKIINANDDEGEAYTVECSVMTYVRVTLAGASGSNNAKAYICNAMYLYYKAAEEYFS